MNAESLYPPAPPGVPADIARLDAAYRLRVLAMIGGLFLFLLLYLLLIAAAGLLAYALLVMPLPEMRGRGMIGALVAKYGGALAAGLLCLFLLKGLFKGRTFQRNSWLPLSAAEHPLLFDFIGRVHREAGAPPPRRVYASCDVNAALVYDTSLLSLVVPPKKDLLIGLGLVNVLEMTEFKAVLAHEFGHFAQRSGGLGSYLHVVNQVLSDVVYGRDRLDLFVDAWARQDVRLAFPAWGLKGVLWGVRKILAGTYEGLNLLHLALSRQLEYNADNVAVRLTGSDAIVHGLSRLDFAAECLAAAGRSLDAAADHGLFSDDLFHHHDRAAARLRTLRKEPRLGLPPDLPADPTHSVQVFQPASDGRDDRHRSHPTEFMRERNAKRVYVRSPTDPRSPWLLFGDAAAVKRAMTELYYRHVLERVENPAPQPAADVQRFIDAEEDEQTFDSRYQGLYDDRFIDPDPAEVGAEEAWTEAAVSAWLAGWPGPDLQARMEAFRGRREEYSLLTGLRSGDLKLKGKTFPFRQREHTIGDVDELFSLVDGELDQDLEALRKLDRAVFVAHVSLARHLDARRPRDPARGPELLSRYGVHLAIRDLLRAVNARRSQLQELLGALKPNQALETDDFRAVRATLQDMHGELLAALERSKGVAMPALANVAAGTPLHDLIIDRGEIVIPELQEDSISGLWLGKLDARLDAVGYRLRRIYFKSLGGLLARQEALATEWAAETAASPPQAANG